MTAGVIGSIALLLALQGPQASITGVVRDEHTGAALAGAVVSLPDLARLTVADAGGRYLLTDVPAGPQHVAIRFLGYAPRTVHALVPATGRLEIGIVLRAEPLRLHTIDVRPPLAVRGLESEDVPDFPDRAHSIAAIRNHPLLAEPDALQSLGGGEVVLEPETPSGVHLRGAGSDQVSYLLDGIPIFSPYHSAGTFSGWNPDALAAIRLSAITPPPEAPDALAGVIEARTRVPASRHGMHGSLGTSQARLTLDGPVGLAGAGYLVSLRSGFAGYPAPDRDPSYLRNESGDHLAKIELDAFGGRLRLLGYENENEISAAAEVDRSEAPVGRNVFEWGGASVGADWRRATGMGGLRVTAWSAGADASASWKAAAGWTSLRSRRNDLGLVVALERGSVAGRSSGGVRLERRTTSYGVTGTEPWALAARSPLLTGFAGHQRPLGENARLDASLAVTAGRRIHLLPRLKLSWSASERWSLSAGYALLRQSEQSLRNPESILGNVFPADLFIGSDAPGVPDARARQLVLAADYRVSPELRLSAQAFDRRARGLLLVAPRGGEPFAAGDFAVGNGTGRGLALTAAARGRRVGFLASYGLQHVRLTYGDTSYVPAHGTRHRFEAGVIVFPSPTLSLRLGAAGAAGRRATGVSGGLEWETCNLLDRGCELSGSPRVDGEPLGARSLPGYLRLDLGARKHWHLRLAGRDASVALFGTITNLLGRRNIMTYSIDPVTGEPEAVDMRPFAPLVVGVDWGF